MSNLGTSSSNVNQSPAQRDPHRSRVGSRGDTSSEGMAPTRRIPSEQWEAKRAIITQLYQEEKRSLKEVMDILEHDHGFSATVKMFKSRIWKWGLDKKLKSDEVLAIMVLKRDRDLLNKESEFTIRGQPVDMDNINRYIKRNPQLVERFNEGGVPSLQTTLEVQCHTPSPRPDSPELMLHSPNPQQRDVPLMLKDYVEEAFYSGLWVFEYDVSCRTQAAEDHSEELFERMLTSLALVNRCMARGDVFSLGAMLSPAFEALKELVATQSPIFATRMITLLWHLDTHHKNDLLQLVVDHMASLVGMVLGQTHPMTYIWQALAEDMAYDYRDFCDSAYTMLVPLLEQKVGSANLLTTMVYGDHVDFLSRIGRHAEALDLCDRYWARAEASGKNHLWLTELTTLKSTMIYAQSDTRNDAPGFNWAAPRSGAFPTGDEQQAILQVRCGNQSMQAGNTTAAIEYYQQALQILEQVHGDERLFVASLANLETAHTRTGNPGEAERIRAVRTQRLDGFATETSALASQQRRTRPASRRPSATASMTMSVMDNGKGRDMEGLTGWEASSAASNSDMPWAWSPEVFMSPSGGTYPANDAHFAPQ